MYRVEYFSTSGKQFIPPFEEAVAGRCSLKFRKIHRKALGPESVLFNKVAGLRPVTLFKKRLWHRCFPVNFAKFKRTLFFHSSHPVAASAFGESAGIYISKTNIKILMGLL